jgi:outer membrane biosynthesis protein TonB
LVSPASPNADLSAQSADIVRSVLRQQLPDIPRNIREKIRGHVNVTVRVLVDPTGNVVGEFMENAGPSSYFARQAGGAAIDWKFVPTDGRGPRVWMLKFEFTRAGTTVRAIGTQ